MSNMVSIHYASITNCFFDMQKVHGFLWKSPWHRQLNLGQLLTTALTIFPLKCIGTDLSQHMATYERKVSTLAEIQST